MRYNLGHRRVWYKVSNVLEQHSGFIFTGVIRWMQTEFSVPTNQISQSHNVENWSFLSSWKILFTFETGRVGVSTGGSAVFILHSSVNYHQVANCNHKPSTGTNITDIDSNAVDARFHGNARLEVVICARNSRERIFVCRHLPCCGECWQFDAV
jgi:hypothetical protein